MVSFRAIDCYQASVPNFQDLDKYFHLILFKLMIKKSPWLSQGESNLIIVQVDLDLLVLPTG